MSRLLDADVVVVDVVDQVSPPKRLFEMMLLLLLLRLVLAMVLIEVRRLCVETERGKSSGDRCVLNMSRKNASSSYKGLLAVRGIGNGLKTGIF